MFRCRAVHLSVPEPRDDALDALRQVTPVGAEGQAAHLGGGFLGGRWPLVGPLDGSQQLLIPGVLVQGLDRHA